MNRAKYEAEICQRLALAERIPFVKVSIAGTPPTVAHCHRNVDQWVEKNPGHSSVRGWITYADFGEGIGLTAHSVVRKPNGEKFDITPLENEAEKKLRREGMRFVEHFGSDDEFFAAVKQSHSMICPQSLVGLDFGFENEEQQENDED